MTIAEYNNCVDKYADPVYRFILKNTRDEEKARDVVQESFARMWERVKEISYDKSRSYLFTTAYHTLIDGLRKDRFRASWDDIPEETGSGEQYSDLREVLDEALDRLPEIQRSVLLLRDYEGYSYEEIGEITGLSDSQVKVYIFRARLALKNYIVSLDLVI